MRQSTARRATSWCIRRRAVSLCRVALGSVPELAGTQVLGNAPNPLLQVVPTQTQGLTITSDAADHDVNMRVLRVVVLHRNPFQIRSHILFHLFDQTARQPRQLYPITEFRRDDQFKQSLVPRALPAFELPGNVDSVVLSIETHVPKW